MTLPDFWRPALTGSAAVRSVLGNAALAFVLLLMARNMDLAYDIALGSQYEGLFMQVSLTVWCVFAGLVLAFTRVFPRPTSVILPALLLVNLAAFLTGYTAIVVTCWTMLHLGRYAPPKWRRPAWLAVIAGVAVSVFFRSEELLRADIVLAVNFYVVSLLVLGFFWMVGTFRRRRDQEMEALHAKAELAAISERTRIAREMHDIIAHSLTAVIAQADGGRYIAAKDPAKATEALETIAATSRSSLAQLRELLSVLRDNDSLPDASTHPDTTPTPGLDAIPQLVRDSENAGLSVTVTEEGERRNLDAISQLTVYRIIQESLTNALKHAGRVDVFVSLTWTKRALKITVHNAPGVSGTVEGAGRGIVGMRERVSLHGGSLDIDDTDGFTVTAWIPVK